MSVNVIGEHVSLTDHAKILCERNTLMEIDDAFLICDLGQIIRQNEKWNHYLPRVQPHYAVKCNEDPVLLRVIKQLGLGFDCASKNEIQTVVDLGVEPDRIIYANPCKAPSHIKYAKNVNVNLMTFDNAAELYKIKRLFPSAKLVLRIFAMDSSARFLLSLKFGCEPKTEGEQLLRLAEELELEIVGISFHVGSGCNDPSAFKVAIADAKHLFDLGPRYGHDSMYILDIGGGFPGVDTDHISFEKVANVVNEAINEHFPTTNGIRVIAEPGRFYACTAFTGCSNVIAKRLVPADKITDDDADCKETGAMYYLNDGKYGTFRSARFDRLKLNIQRVGNSPKSTSVMWSSIWGPTCDSVDLLDSMIELPELHVGDWLIYENHGAYTMASATTFNGFDRQVVHYVARPSDCLVLNGCIDTMPTVDTAVI